MPETKTPEEIIAEILKDNITFSGQVGSYVIHGAIEKIMQQSRSTAIGFAEWLAINYGAHGPGVIFYSLETDQDKGYTAEELYDRYLQSLNIK